MKDKSFHIAVKILLYWYIFIFFSTEFLSYFHILERNYILLGEIFYWTFFLFFYHQEILRIAQRINFRSKSILLISIFFLLTFIQGFFSAPNSTDSMVYHLPRVMYWVQEKTLFQDVIRGTHDYMPPFGEYILLHLYLLVGDRLLFFSQWIGYVATVILSGLIASYLGANKKVSGLVSLLVATIPVATMQATSVKVDMIVAALIVLCTYIVLFLKKDNILDYVMLGFALGLGTLTKQTFLLYSVIPIGIFAVRFLKTKKRSPLLPLLTIVLICLIQTRFILQNLSLYNNEVVSSNDYLGYVNQNFTAAGLFSNLIKNILLHIPGLVYTRQIETSVLNLHKFLGIDVNDCSTTFCDPAFRFKVVPIIFPQEDVASNTFHLLLIFIAGVVLLIQIIKLKSNFTKLSFYFLSIFSFVLFSSTLKWQPFHSRLHLPFFVMGTIASALILSESKIGLLILKAISVISILVTIVLINLNVLRPYISYDLFFSSIKSFVPAMDEIPTSFFVKSYNQQYFNSRPYWYKPYQAAMPIIAQKGNEHTIAFHLMDDFEYPLWVLIKKQNIKTHIIPYSQITDSSLIVSTTKEPFYLNAYSTTCIKTDIDYGYICISEKKRY